MHHGIGGKYISQNAIEYCQSLESLSTGVNAPCLYTANSTLFQANGHWDYVVILTRMSPIWHGAWKSPRFRSVLGNEGIEARDHNCAVVYELRSCVEIIISGLASSKLTNARLSRGKQRIPQLQRWMVRVTRPCPNWCQRIGLAFLLIPDAGCITLLDGYMAQ
jgi:hypothetical protein